jgi:hypothetical protein
MAFPATSSPASASFSEDTSWLPAVARGRGFIASGLYDAVFFILAPVLALALVEIVARWPWASELRFAGGVVESRAVFFVLVWSHAHACAVFFRSHGNRAIFVQHRFAFVGMPLLLFVGLMGSDWVMACALVLAPFWATYHIGMQNFGLGRIYDVRWGNPPEMGRTLDYWLHQLINVAPFLVGWSLLPSLQSLRVFDRVGWEAPSRWLEAHQSVEGALSGAFLIAGPLYLAFYVHAYWRLTHRGYRLCPQKIALLVSTAAASVVAWGFLTPWKALFVMNFFHGLQYFALVWWTERRNLGRVTRLERVPLGTPVLLIAFAATTLLVGTVFQTYGRNYTLLRWAAAVGLVISLMHYWYDGFVWSVRRREV